MRLPYKSFHGARRRLVDSVRRPWQKYRTSLLSIQRKLKHPKRAGHSHRDNDTKQSFEAVLRIIKRYRYKEWDNGNRHVSDSSPPPPPQPCEGPYECKDMAMICVYVQYEPDDGEDHDPMKLDLIMPWMRSFHCEACARNLAGSLHCGGLYHNVRFYRNGMPWESHAGLVTRPLHLD